MCSRTVAHFLQCLVFIVVSGISDLFKLRNGFIIFTEGSIKGRFFILGNSEIVLREDCIDVLHSVCPFYIMFILLCLQLKVSQITSDGVILGMKKAPVKVLKSTGIYTKSFFIRIPLFGYKKTALVGRFI